MKVAILFRGGISKKIGRLLNPGDIDVDSEFVNYISAYNSFKKHILNSNSSHDIDIFIHCWHTELENELKNLYNPKQIIIEPNSKYKAQILNKIVNSWSHRSNFGLVSSLLSMKKVCNMATEYCNENNFEYDLIVVYRLDLLLLKDMKFESYDTNAITCNNFADEWGDFHYVMDYHKMLKFKDMYDNFCPSFQPIEHQTAKNYAKILNIKYKQDDIIAGYDQEVVRKAKILIDSNAHSYEELEKYGLSKEEILSYMV